MTRLQAAYIAGLIDGEGTIGMFANAAPSRPRPATLARVKIGMTDERMIRWLQRVTTDGQVSSWQGNGARQKRCHVIQWNGRKALPLLRAVLPFLRLKKPQAAILIEWILLSTKTQARLLQNDRNHRAFPPELLRKRDAMIGELRALNHRGTLIS
jgi:hypothetical protein